MTRVFFPTTFWLRIARDYMATRRTQSVLIVRYAGKYFVSVRDEDPTYTKSVIFAGLPFFRRLGAGRQYEPFGQPEDARKDNIFGPKFAPECGGLLFT